MQVGLNVISDGYSKEVSLITMLPGFPISLVMGFKKAPYPYFVCIDLL